MGSNRRTKSHAEVRQEFIDAGLSIKDWARTHGFSPWVVYALLSRKSPAVRGEMHRAAVQLGIKRGRASIGAAEAGNV
jgi:gp16 family phage-associated protein